MGYTVVQELKIPQHLRERAIEPGLLEAFGIASMDVLSNEALLAQIELIQA